MTSLYLVHILWRIHYYLRILLLECKAWSKGESIEGFSMHYFVAGIRNRGSKEYAYNCLKYNLLVSTKYKQSTEESDNMYGKVPHQTFEW